jgi:hypothetical protein
VKTYKDLLMTRNAFLELRNRVQRELSAHPELSGGQILAMDVDPDTGDLMVTGQYKHDDTTVQRTHRITITEETVL